ncbi:MAG: hypothetical protein HZB35_03980 [Nitrospirae bacterium]|nr:hypothetical protein [Nitrospirota bacterium]
MDESSRLTTEGLELVQDRRFFLTKVRITEKVAQWLKRVHAVLQEDLRHVALLASADFDPEKSQYVQGYGGR